MSAAQYNLTIEQGATFTRTMTITDTVTGLPLNLTSWTPYASIKRLVTDTTSLADFSFSIDAPATGVMVMELSATDTAALAPTGLDCSRSYAWDLYLVHLSGEVLKLFTGLVYVNKQVTEWV